MVHSALEAMRFRLLSFLLPCDFVRLASSNHDRTSFCVATSNRAPTWRYGSWPFIRFWHLGQWSFGYFASHTGRSPRTNVALESARSRSLLPHRHLGTPPSRH